MEKRRHARRPVIILPNLVRNKMVQSPGTPGHACKTASAQPN
jgi:hypothetical protein